MMKEDASQFDASPRCQLNSLTLGTSWQYTLFTAHANEKNVILLCSCKSCTQSRFNLQKFCIYILSL